MREEGDCRMIMDNAILFAWFSIGSSEIIVSAVRMTKRALRGHRFDPWVLTPPLEPILGAIALTVIAGIYAVYDTPSYAHQYFVAWISGGHTVLRVLHGVVTERAEKRRLRDLREHAFWKDRVHRLEIQVAQLQRESKQ